MVNVASNTMSGILKTGPLGPTSAPCHIFHLGFFIIVAVIIYVMLDLHILILFYIYLFSGKNYLPTYLAYQNMKLQHIQRFNRGNMDAFYNFFLLFSSYFAQIWQHGAYRTLLNATFFTRLSTHPSSLLKYKVTAYTEI